MGDPSPHRSVGKPPAFVGTRKDLDWSPDLDPYDRASVAVDCAVFTVEDSELKLLTWRRKNDPEVGHLALPGRFVRAREEPADAVEETLKTKTFLTNVPALHQIGAISYPERDTRGWVVSFIFCGVLPAADLRRSVPGDDRDVVLTRIAAARGHKVSPDDIAIFLPGGEGRELALGHNELVAVGLEWLRREISTSNIALDLLPETFTLKELQIIHEAVLGEPVNKDSLRRSVLRTRAWIQPTGERRPVYGRKEAELFRRAS